jgi:DNA-binding Lrp family transcriptional regulator
MVHAIVLLQVDMDKINSTAEILSEIKGISEVYSVSGSFDLIAIVRIKDNDELAEIVTKRMLKAEGIKRTETLIAFRVYSRYELERMFSIGNE